MKDKVKYGERFYYINNTGFQYKYDETEQRLTGVREKWIRYYKIIPVYVYAINKVWDGEETFDICPTPLNELKKGESWHWKREMHYEDIGIELWKSRNEAEKAYRKKYTKEQRRDYEKAKKLEKLQGYPR